MYNVYIRYYPIYKGEKEIPIYVYTRGRNAVYISDNNYSVILLCLRPLRNAHRLVYRYINTSRIWKITLKDIRAMERCNLIITSLKVSSSTQHVKIFIINFIRHIWQLSIWQLSIFFGLEKDNLRISSVYNDQESIIRLLVISLENGSNDVSNYGRNMRRCCRST